MLAIISFIKGIIPWIIKYWKLVLIISVFIFGIILGYKYSSNSYQAEIIKLNNTISEYNTAYNTLSELTNKQNTAVINLKTAQDKKTKELEIAQNAARNASKAFYDEANTLQRKTPNKASNACLEASKLIDEELQKERK